MVKRRFALRAIILVQRVAMLLARRLFHVSSGCHNRRGYAAAGRHALMPYAGCRIVRPAKGRARWFGLAGYSREFVPVAMVYRFGYVMVGRKDLPQADVKEIVAAAKQSPGSISVATAGVGTGQHLVAAAFMK